MQLSGSYTLAAARARAWRALNDPAVLAAAIPGCESLDAVGEGVLAARLRVRLGPVHEVFEGHIRLGAGEAPDEAGGEFALEGTGAELQGEVRVRLSDAKSGAATLATYEGRVRPGGKLAAVGQEVFARAVHDAVASFAASLNAQIGGAEAERSLPDAAAPAPHAPVAAAPIAPRSGPGADTGSGTVATRPEERPPRWPDVVLAVGVVLFLGIVLLMWMPAE